MTHQPDTRTEHETPPQPEPLTAYDALVELRERCIAAGLHGLVPDVLRVMSLLPDEGFDAARLPVSGETLDRAEANRQWQSGFDAGYALAVAESRLREALTRIEAWTRDPKGIARPTLRGLLAMIHDTALAALTRSSEARSEPMKRPDEMTPEDWADKDERP